MPCHPILSLLLQLMALSCSRFPLLFRGYLFCYPSLCPTLIHTMKSWSGVKHLRQPTPAQTHAGFHHILERHGLLSFHTATAIWLCPHAPRHLCPPALLAPTPSFWLWFLLQTIFQYFFSKDLGVVTFLFSSKTVLHSNLLWKLRLSWDQDSAPPVLKDLIQTSGPPVFTQPSC